MARAASSGDRRGAAGPRSHAGHWPPDQLVVHDWPGWTHDEIRSVSAPALLIIGDRDFVRLDHAAEMLDLFPDSRLAVLPDTKHTEVMERSEQLRVLVPPFLA